MKQKSLISRLLKIGTMMSEENDVDSILSLITKELKQITNAHFSTIATYEVEKGIEYLNYKYRGSDSKKFSDELKFKIDNTSIIGNCFINKEAYNFKDMSEVESVLGFKYDRSFDEEANTYTHNLLVVPLINLQKECLGVLLLANKMVDGVATAFTSDELEIATSLTSQAATLIDRANFYDEVEQMVQSIIEALGASLERRDPVTSGHSRRVARISLELINHLAKRDYGPFAKYQPTEDEIRELYFSALLHDIGKIGVHGSLLRKNDKLTAEQLEIIRLRLTLIEMKLQESNHSLTSYIPSYFERLKSINESKMLTDDDFDFLISLGKKNDMFDDYDFLTEEEFDKLSVRVGSLTNKERNHIKEHAEISKEILGNVHWTKRLLRIPLIAGAHHEKLDGSGYPNNLVGDQIPLESQIIGIVDIYDALITTDRPYKNEMTTSEALALLAQEAKTGKISEALVSEFIDMVSQKGLIKSK